MCADHEPTLQEISASPPPSPTDLRASPLASGFRLTWQPPATNRSLTYRMLRKAGSAPCHVEDGDVVGEGRSASLRRRQDSGGRRLVLRRLRIAGQRVLSGAGGERSPPAEPRCRDAARRPAVWSQPRAHLELAARHRGVPGDLDLRSPRGGRPRANGGTRPGHPPRVRPRRLLGSPPCRAPPALPRGARHGARRRSLRAARPRGRRAWGRRSASPIRSWSRRRSCAGR